MKTTITHFLGWASFQSWRQSSVLWAGQWCICWLVDTNNTNFWLVDTNNKPMLTCDWLIVVFWAVEQREEHGGDPAEKVWLWPLEPSNWGIKNFQINFSEIDFCFRKKFESSSSWKSFILLPLFVCKTLSNIILYLCKIHFCISFQDFKIQS